MRKRKIISILLLVMIVINTMPIQLLANNQRPLDTKGINKITISNTKRPSGEKIIVIPKVQVEWVPTPQKNGMPSGDKTINDQEDPQYYVFQLKDLESANGKTAISQKTIPYVASSTSYIAQVEEYMATIDAPKSGKFYQVDVLPRHDHITYDKDGNQIGSTPAPLSPGSTSAKMFLTDFNTEAVSTDDGGIEVTWEYIPGARYQVYYKEGDYNIASKINANAPNKSVISAKVASETQVTDSSGVKKVKFIIPNSDPGKTYSVYVEVIGFDNEYAIPFANGEIAKNASYDEDGPKVVQASTKVVLNVFDASKDKIRLEWDTPVFGELLDKQITDIVIWERKEGELEPGREIGHIKNPNAKSFEYPKPTVKTYYKIEFKNGENKVTETSEVPYTPTESWIVPLQPKVPKLFKRDMLKETDFASRYHEYIVSDDKVTISKMEPNTFHQTNKSPAEIQLVWDAPKDNNGQVDYELVYDIWVTDKKIESALDEKNYLPILSNFSIAAGSENNLIKRELDKQVVGFKRILAQYTTHGSTPKPIVSNKTYYIKIVAKRKYASDYAESTPTVVVITLDKYGDIFSPPILAKPPLQLKGTTINTATIKWLERWYEIMPKSSAEYEKIGQKKLAEQWNSIVYLPTSKATTPAIVFAEITDPALKAAYEQTPTPLLTAGKLNEVVGKVESFDEAYISRETILGADVKYQIISVLQDELDKKAAAENKTIGEWIASGRWDEQWVASQNLNNWQDITPGDQSEGVLNWKEYNITGLAPNTKYVTLIRAYRMVEVDGELKQLSQTFPSYILYTTKSNHPDIEEIPKAPKLEVYIVDGKKQIGDTHITVTWQYNNSFDYIIHYSRLNDPEKGTPWEFKISDIPGDENYVADGSWPKIKITGLMPETTYNIWIQAKQKKGTEKSDWSNPVTETTLALETPAMPTGLGPAAYQSILEIGQDFPPVGKDYITVEWVKNANDTEDDDGNAEKRYSYIVEFADNPEFLDAILVDTKGPEVPGNNAGERRYEVLAKNIVRFNNLIANRPYYVKVKTVLTFKDTEGSREIIRQSEYTQWVRIITLKSSDEYDGGENDNIIIYPEAIIETYTNDIWTIEIVDAAKIISDILKKKDYFFTIKAERYNNKQDAAVRRIKIPKSVIDALINQRMEFRVITNTGVYEIPAKALAIYTNKYSAKDVVQFEFTKIADYKIAAILRSYPETLLKAEQLDIGIKSKTNTTIIKKLDGYIRAKIKLDAAKEYLYKDLFAYTYNFDTSTWVKANYSIDTLTDTYVSYLTPTTGIYSVYQKVNQGSTQASTFAMNSLSNSYGISGLGTVYRRTDAVNRNQFIHLMLGVAQNKSQIDLMSPVYTETLTKARAAGIYTDTAAGTINQEQAIAGVIKLYELKNGFKVKPSSVKFNNVSLKYQEAVSKAYAIGLIETINPKQAVTYEILGDWILQVTE